MIKNTRPVSGRSVPRLSREWPTVPTRSEGAWSMRPDCPMPPREIAAYGFLRDRLHITTGASPLAGQLTDNAVDATLRLMLRRTGMEA